MTGELNKRVLITLALLLVSRALSHIPIPGIDFTAISHGLPSGTPWEVFSGAFSRATIGTLDIMPYLSASVIVVLFFYFRRFRRGIDERDFPIEFYALCLTIVIALLQGYGIAIFLENMRLPSGIVAVLNPGWGFRLMTMLSIAAGTFLLVWLAHLISQKGLGNGVCLITLSGFLDNTLPALVDFWMKSNTSRLGEDASIQIVFILIPLAVISFLAVLALIAAQWQPPLQPLQSDSASPSVLRLRINAVGVIGLYVAQSLLFIPATLVVILPASFPGRMLLQRISELGVINWLTWGILVFVATYFWTAWAYRPSGLQSILNKFPNAGSPLAANEFERKLAMVTLPLALGLPLIASAFFWVAQKFSFQALPASILFPVAAISLDLFRQFKIHRRMAAAFSDDQKEEVCGACHAGTSHDDQFCPACGIGFEENVYCDTHAATAASSHCVICHRKLCEACRLVVQGRHVCEEHHEVELIEGWATAAIATTRLEAALHQQQLEKLGMAARVLSNTIEPIYGTLGMFEINPVTPFLIYREVGGGRIRLMVPAAEWLRAQQHLAGAEELDELSRHT